MTGLKGDEVAEIRTDPTITSADGLVTPTDARGFHDAEPGDGRGLTIAVRDSGIDDTHPVFDGITVEHPDIPGLPTNGQDNVGHGTGCAGLIALAVPNVDRLINVPIFGDEGRTDGRTIKQSYEWLIDHADEIDFVNDSWGASSKVEWMDRWHNELEQAGVDSVVAAGNTDQQTGSPATAERAYAVAACTVEGRMTRFSSPTDDIAVVGKDIALPKATNTQMGPDVPESEYCSVMRQAGGDWIKASGTSFSAPRLLGYGAVFRTEDGADTSAGTNDFEKDETRAFERAFNYHAVDIKGTGEDGQGYLDYDAAYEGGDPAPEPVDVRVWSILGGPDWIHLQGTDLFEDGEYEADPELLKKALTPKGDGDD